jgi:hypothetical protein
MRASTMGAQKLLARATVQYSFLLASFRLAASRQVANSRTQCITSGGSDCSVAGSCGRGGGRAAAAWPRFGEAVPRPPPPPPLAVAAPLPQAPLLGLARACGCSAAGTGPARGGEPGRPAPASPTGGRAAAAGRALRRCRCGEPPCCCALAGCMQAPLGVLAEAGPRVSPAAAAGARGCHGTAATAGALAGPPFCVTAAAAAAADRTAGRGFVQALGLALPLLVGPHLPIGGCGWAAPAASAIRDVCAARRRRSQRGVAGQDTVPAATRRFLATCWPTTGEGAQAAIVGPSRQGLLQHGWAAPRGCTAHRLLCGRRWRVQNFKECALLK